MSAATAGQLLPLAPLREDLKLFAATANRDGSPAWVIQDPVTNRFFRIGWLEFEILARWGMRDPAAVAQAVSAETPLQIAAEDVQEVGRFFRRQQLVQVTEASGVAFLSELARRSKLSHWKWLLSNYLFIRVPLVRPQRFLQWLAPWCDLFYTRSFKVLAVLATVLGLVLALRQWDVFVGTFTDFMSVQGIAGYLVAIAAAKTLHEMGHAITATRLGVRVAHMGVAFLVLWPMLYTDTGESWKLSRRRDRFRIAAAGMAIELALAGFATLAWSLAPEGGLRSALFFLATTSWILTLGINASPFMRFDGYFLLSDALDLPNLHARSFALARAALRRTLFGWDEPDPEPFSPGLRRFLLVFAWLTWAYRLVVFLGIAVAVYLFFFKVLGIFLFIVELVWFLARPLWSEVQVWINRRHETGSARTALLALLLAGVFAVMALPWQGEVSGPAWLHTAQSQMLYSPFAARLVSIVDNGEVQAGQVLAELDSPDIRSRAGRLNTVAETLRRQADQSVGRADGTARRNLIIEQLGGQLARLESERQELARLRLVAPFAGRIVDREHDLQAGAWVSADEPLATLIDPSSWVIDALVSQDDVARVQVGASVRFYRQGDPGAPLTGAVVSIDTVVAQSLPDPIFNADFGGPVATVRLPEGRIVPRDPKYRVRISLAADQSEQLAGQVSLGAVSIEGARRSPLMHWLRTAASVLVRESGF